MPCDPTTLAANASCELSCLPVGNQWAILIAQYCGLNGMSCNITALEAEARCVQGCINEGLYLPVMILLMQQLAGNTQTPQELANAARCIESCLPPGMQLPALINLTCDISGGGAGAGISAPIATAATNADIDTFDANWGAVSDATGYILDVSELANFNTFVAGYNSLDVGNVTTLNVIGLNSATDYYYRVRAYNATATSLNSNVITTTTTAAPPLTNLVQWLRANDVDQADGTEVLSWEARIGLDATGTAGAVPTFETNVQNGLPAISFPGANQFLQTADYAVPIIQPYYIFIAYRLRVDGVGQILVDTAHNDTERSFLIRSNTDIWRAFAGGNSVFTGAGQPSTVPTILAVLFNGASSSFRFDLNAAALLAGGSPGTQGADSLRIGNANDASNDAQVDVFEVLIYDAAVDPVPVVTYLSAKWDIP